MLNTVILRPFKLEQHQRPISKGLIYSSVFFVMVAFFIKLWTPISLNRWPEAFYTLTFFYGLFKERQWLWKHPMVLGLFAAIIATPLLFFINYLQDPIRAVEYAHFEKLIRVYLFVPIAYWLSFNRNHIYAFILLSFLGFVTACLLDPNLAQTFATIKAGGRVDFGLKNAQHTALWGGVFLIAFLCLFKETTKIKSLIVKLCIQMAFLIGISFSTLTIYTSETRAVFIGLIATLLGYIIILFIKNFKLLSSHKKLLSVAMTFLIIFSISYAILFTNNPLKARFESEKNVIASIFTGDLSQVPISSIGIRIHSWASAISWIKEKPIVGWGGDVREHVIDSVPAFNDKLKEDYGHLHNTVFEFWVSYGLVGLLIAIIPLVWIFTSGFITLNNALSLFAFQTNILFVSASLFESYLFFWPGAFTLGIIASPLLARRIKKNRSNFENLKMNHHAL